MGEDERWLAAAWPFVRESLPPAPAVVLELGCGPIGGFVPELRGAGYVATGVDPEAPIAPGYYQLEFERYQPEQQVDAVVASTSLHHVADLDFILDKISSTLVPGGRIIVVEWAWERIDEATATWAFERIDESAEPTWLSRRRDEWLLTGERWGTYFTTWARGHGLHPSDYIRSGLDRHFDRLTASEGAYFFPACDHTTQDDEEAAIASGAIRATSIWYVGQRR